MLTSRDWKVSNSILKRSANKSHIERAEYIKSCSKRALIKAQINKAATALTSAFEYQETW